MVSILSALTATTMPVFIDVGVQQVIKMPFRAASLARISRSLALSAQHVNFVAHWFKMGWINTQSLAAQMIQRERFGEHAPTNFIGNSVGEVHSPIPPCHTVSFGIGASCPEPALVRAALRYFSPEPDLQGHGGQKAPGLKPLASKTCLRAIAGLNVAIGFRERVPSQA